MLTPEKVSLSNRETQTFTTEATQLELIPSIGELKDKTYTAPRRIFLNRKLILKATDPANPSAGGEAVIELSSNAFWIPAIAVYYGALILATLFGATRVWPGGGPTCEQAPSACTLTVSPPAVTLQSGQILRFYANLGSRTAGDVAWTASSGSITAAGDFAAPAVDKDPVSIKISARHNGTGKSAEATVLVRKVGSLILSPSVTSLAAGQQHTITASGPAAVTWMDVSGEDGRLEEKKGATANYKAPDVVAFPRTVILTAHNAAIGLASAAIFLQASNTNGSGAGLFHIALLFAFLGGVVSSSRSFVNFVGSQRFRGTWGLFYLLRPWFAASLGLFVHAAHRAGFLGSGSDNSFVVAFYAALVGLFSDTVLEKLKQFVDYILVFTDSRPDKMPRSTPAPPTVTTTASTTTTTPATPGAVPAVPFPGSVTQIMLKGGKLIVDGSGFTPGTFAEIDSRKLIPASFATTRLEFQLDPAVHVAGRQGSFVLVGANGGRTAPRPISFI